MLFTPLFKGTIQYMHHEQNNPINNDIYVTVRRYSTQKSNYYRKNSYSGKDVILLEVCMNHI